MARRRRSWSEIIPTLIILAIFGAVGIFAAFRNERQAELAQEEAARQASIAAEQKEIEQQLAAEYNISMSILRTEGYKCNPSSSKAVTLMKEESEQAFKKDYIPEDYIAESPQDVRYIVHIESDTITVGQYLGGGLGLQPRFEIEIVDLSSGETIATETFLGGQPPQSVQSGSGSHTGRLPDKDTITDWIASAISSS